MKIILENWKGFINEGTDYAEENARFVLRNSVDNHRGDMSSEFVTRMARPLTVAGLFSRIPQLTNNKVTKVLGLGTKGLALGLDNGRALKLYKMGYIGDEEKFYDREADKIFGGRGDVSTLPVFDRGVVDIDEEHDPVKYVEMAQVTVFEEYMKLTGRSDDETQYVQDLIEMMPEFVQSVRRGEQHDDIKRLYMEDLKSYAKWSNLSKVEIEGLLAMVTYILMNYGWDYTQDLHVGNFGVVSQTIGKPRPYFVLFDP
jgi:hypothetical protein